MTRLAAILLTLFVGSAVAAATTPTDQDKVAVVLGSEVAGQPKTVAGVKARAGDVQVRVARTSGEELGVTHQLAALGYDTVITVGIDRRVAIAPVAAQYPGTRFVAASPGSFARYL